MDPKTYDFDELYGKRYTSGEFIDMNPNNVDFSQAHYDQRKKEFRGAIELPAFVGVLPNVENAIQEFEAHDMWGSAVMRTEDHKSGLKRDWLVFDGAKVTDPEQEKLKERRLVAFDKLSAGRGTQFPQNVIRQFQIESISAGIPVRRPHPNLDTAYKEMNARLLDQQRIDASSGEGEGSIDGLFDSVFDGVFDSVISNGGESS